MKPILLLCLALCGCNAHVSVESEPTGTNMVLTPGHTQTIWMKPVGLHDQLKAETERLISIYEHKVEVMQASILIAGRVGYLAALNGSNQVEVIQYLRNTYHIGTNIDCGLPLWTNTAPAWNLELAPSGSPQKAKALP